MFKIVSSSILTMMINHITVFMICLYHLIYNILKAVYILPHLTSSGKEFHAMAPAYEKHCLK